MAAYVDDWADDGSGAPDLDRFGYGMIHFEPDEQSTLSYMGGLAFSTDPDAHVAEKWSPFIFPNHASTGATGKMVLDAWDALIYAKVPGFRDVDPDEIRVVDSHEQLRLYPRVLLIALENEKVFEVHERG